MKPVVDADSFGAIDADNDDLLLDSFEDHDAFLDILAYRRYLIIGRKGSGKTAIFKRILTIDDELTFTFGHTFSDYPWHYHAKQARVGIPDFDKFTHSWKYLVLLTVSKILLNQDQSLPCDEASMEALEKIEKFVIDTYGTRDPDVTQIFTPTKRLKLKPTFELDFKLLKAGVSPESVPMDELPSVVQEVNANLLRYTLASMNREHRYFVAFDQLDLGFDPTNPEYVSRLIGLLLACRDINIAARQATQSLFVVVFLRDDIYDALHFEDKNKITDNFVSTIEWDTPRTDKTLKQLMEKRFSAVLGEGQGIVKWEDVFDETKEMPGRQTKYQQLLDRTYLRPRDMIKFVNTVLGQHKTRHAAGEYVGSKLENTDIHRARPEYSDYLQAELDDEVQKHVPGFERYLDLLRQVGVWQFERDQFELVARKRPDLVEDDTVPAMLERLYTFSIIGFYRAGGRGFGGSEYVFKYREPRARFDAMATRFRVHTGLIEVLGLKKFTIGSAMADGSDEPLP